jgi:hypothetical protein
MAPASATAAGAALRQCGRRGGATAQHGRRRPLPRPDCLPKLPPRRVAAGLDLAAAAHSLRDRAIDLAGEVAQFNLP